MKRSVYTIGSLIILLIAAFIFVLVPIFSGGKIARQIPPFGKYDGTPVKLEQNSDFANAVSQTYEYYKNLYDRQGQELPQGAGSYIYQIAFNETIKRIAYTKAVQKSGWKAPKTAVNRAVRAYFPGDDGQFSQKQYNIAVRENPDAVEQLRSELVKSITYQRYADDSFGTTATLQGQPLYGLKSSGKETEFLRNLDKEQASYNLAVFNMSDYPDSEKASYGKANASKFIRYDFSVITVNDKAKAASILKRINENAVTFEDSVAESIKSYSTDSGKINNKYHYQIEKFLANAEDMEKLSSLKAGELSDVIQTSVGYSIFKADSDAVEPNFSDSQILSIVNNYLNLNEASYIENYFKEKAESLVKATETSSFRSATARFGAELKTIPASPLNYGNVSVLSKFNTSDTGLYGLERNENFLKTAFALKVNEVSEPIVNGQSIIVLQRTATTSSSEEPIPDEALRQELSGYDISSSDSSILNSPKTVNNVQAVYRKYIEAN